MSNGFSMTYKQITDPNFGQAMQFLTSQGMPIKVSYNIKKLTDAIQIARKQIGAEYHKEIVLEFAKKKEDGTIAHPLDADGKENKNEFDIDEARKEELEKAQEAFGRKVYNINRDKIFLESLENMKISASLLGALDPILTEMSEELSGSGVVSAGNVTPLR